MSLAERGAFGLVENAIFMGAPVPTSREDWKAIRSVVAGRVVNIYSASDFILAFLYRTSSIQLGVAGLQAVEGVKGVENIDVGNVVEGHLRYRYVVGMLLKDVLGEDIELAEVGKEEKVLRTMDEKEREEKGEEDVEGDIDDVVEKAEKELEERRRKRQEEEERQKQEAEKETKQ